jgi:hypothetical protein
MNRAKSIKLIRGDRFISYHEAAEVYYDSQYKVIKARMEGGVFFELLKERQADGSYRHQMLSTMSSTGDRVTIEYPRNQL